MPPATTTCANSASESLTTKPPAQCLRKNDEYVDEGRKEWPGVPCRCLRDMEFSSGQAVGLPTTRLACNSTAPDDRWTSTRCVQVGARQKNEFLPRGIELLFSRG